MKPVVKKWRRRLRSQPEDVGNERALGSELGSSSLHLLNGKDCSNKGQTPQHSSCLRFRALRLGRAEETRPRWLACLWMALWSWPISPGLATLIALVHHPEYSPVSDFTEHRYTVIQSNTSGDVGHHTQDLKHARAGLYDGAPTLQAYRSYRQLACL